MLFNWFFRRVAKFVPVPKAPEIADIVAAIDMQAVEKRLLAALMASETMYRIEQDVLAYCDGFYDRVEEKLLTTIAAKVRSLGFEEKAILTTTALLNVEQLRKEVVANVVDKIDPDKVIECATVTVADTAAEQLVQRGGLSPITIIDHIYEKLSDVFLEKHKQDLIERARKDALILARGEIDSVHDAMQRALNAVAEAWQ